MRAPEVVRTRGSALVRSAVQGGSRDLFLPRRTPEGRNLNVRPKRDSPQPDSQVTISKISAEPLLLQAYSPPTLGLSNTG